MLRMPEAVPIVEGVWWLRGTRGCNVYACRLSDGGVVLVDSGTSGSAGAVAEGLRSAGIDSGEVRALLLTHGHADHAGGAAELRKVYGLAVVAGAGDVAGDRLSGPSSTTIDVVLPVDRESEPFAGVVAVPAPGHTPGSMCYLLPDRDLMFIGDIALHSGDHMSRPIPPSNDDTAAQERSLSAIAARAPAHGAPGHGDPLTDRFGEWMRELASKPPAPGPWFLRLLLNPRLVARFLWRSLGGN